MPVLIALLLVHVLVPGPGGARAQLAGRIDAEFGVNERGAATWVVPIVVPPGTAGMEPAFALVYDSQQGNGPLGAGFALAGTSAITRCDSDLARDGFIRAVAFDAADAFCLDGQRLVLVRGTHGADGSEYRTERESWTRIVARGTGPIAFEATGRDGIVRFYGSTPDSRVEAQGRSAARVWALARTEDRSGNAVRFSYLEDSAAGEYLLARADYTENARVGMPANASVRFLWLPRPDPESGFVAGSKVSSGYRLASIETWLEDERVREYRLSYGLGPSTGRSRLASLTVCGLRGECLPPTRFAWLDGTPGWTRGAGWSLPRQLWRETRQEGVLADLDADGRVDLVHGGSSTQSRTGWLNTGSGFASAPGFRPPGDLFSATLGFPHAQIIDLDGDGLPEYVRSFRSGADSLEIATHRNLGDRWESTPTAVWATPGFIWDYKDDRPQQTAVLADVNGDGLPDFVRSFESALGNEVRETRLNTGAGFGAPDVRWATPVRLFSYKGGEHQTQSILHDLNGDGLPELVQAFDDAESGKHQEVWINTGAGFTGPAPAWRLPGVIWDYEHQAPRQEGELVDVNGDGLADFVVAYKGSSGSENVETWLNTGTGWRRATDWDLPAFLWNYENGKTLQTAQLVDANGDGLPDLVRAYVASSGVRWRDTWLNTGEGFPGAPQTSPEYDPPEEVWSYSNDTPKQKATFADLDGDGRADFVKAYRTSSLSAESHLADAPPGDRIVSITDGLGAAIAIEYAPLSDGSVYERGAPATFPEQRVTDARPVVRRFAVGANAAALRWSRLRYGGLRVDLRRRAELGFAWRETEDESSGIATTIRARQDWPLHGLVDVEEREHRAGAGRRVIARTRHHYVSAPGAAEGVAVIAEDETTVERYELDGAPIGVVRTTRLFDEFGNAREQRIDWGEGYTRHTRTSFRNDPERWILGLPERVETVASAPGFAAQTRIEEFSHEPDRGLLIRNVSEPDRPGVRVETDLVRDLFGNVVSQSIRGPDFEPRTSAWLFESRGRFADVTLDAVGQARSQITDARSGAPISRLGPDFSIPPTRIGYDALGRLTSTTRPDGVTTTTTRGACAAGCPAGAALAVRTETPGAPTSTRYLDGAGRELRAEVVGFDGRAVRVDSSYDVRGNLTSRSRPFYAGEGAHLATWQRDALDRVTRRVDPDGSETRWGRSARSMTTTDARGHTRTEILNARGELVESIDALGARTSFAADAFGNPALVRDPRGTETRFEYDALGRQIGIDDPDLGAWAFAYDALGQRVAQLDARGVLTLYAWDRLGRPIRREGGGPTVRWVWDSAANGVGQLARVETSPAGFAREHEYDAFGRPVRTVTRVGATSFGLEQSYDALGRQATLRYPTGFAIRNDYTATGYLESVRDAADGSVYWRAEARAADGQVERERLGNGVLTERIRDPRNGRLTALLAGVGGDTSVQSLHYGWDAVGNLDAREDWNRNRFEALSYDPLDRLEAATRADAGTESFAYDAAGNLVYKTGVGAYAYPSPQELRPHAVRSVDLDARSFTYDENGNMLADGRGKAWLWSARNQPVGITTPGPDGGWEFLSYAPEGALLSRLEIPTAASSHASYTLQIGDVFEQATDLVARATESRHLIHAEGALVAVRVLKPGAPAENRFVHRDHLESIDAVTDAAAAIVERHDYDVHGRSVAPRWALARGYTGHVPLPRSRSVHMRGRVYDPELGRFLSPDPLVAAPQDLQALNRYAYVRNNPLTFVDPTGFLLEPPVSSGAQSSESAFDGFGGALHAIAGAFGNGFSAVSSFMSSAWGGVRFGATAAWAGVSWLGARISSGARWAGAGAIAAASLAWSAVRRALPDALPGGILPDERTPGGILQNIVMGVRQFATQELEIYDVTPRATGQRPLVTRRTMPIGGGNLFVNGQLNDLDDAIDNGARAFGDQPFILLYGAEENLVSDTVESALLKFLPSRASRQLAEVLAGLTAPAHLIAHSQGALTAFWGLRLAGGGRSNLRVDFFGAATSTPAYRFALSVAGASPGPFGYAARANDPVPTFVGGNFNGGWLAPGLIPMRAVASALFIPLLGSARHSPHSHYP